MSKFLEQEMCLIHNQSCVAINLAQSTNFEDLLLCIKCLAEKKSNNKSVLLINEVVTILQEIKLKEYERKKFEIEQSLQRYQASVIKIQDFIDSQKRCLVKVLTQFNSEIEIYLRELNQLKQPKAEDLVKSDIQVLFKHLNGQNSKNLQQISNISQERTKEFILLVEKQLQDLQQDDKFKQILSYFNEIINQKEARQQTIVKLIENQLDLTKTPFLKHLCSKHGKEIIMFSLDKDYLGERILCVDCIPNFKNEVITLEDANRLWIQYQDELYENQNKFLSEIVQKYLQTQEIILLNEGKLQKIQNDMKQLIETYIKETKSQQEEQYNKNKKKSLIQYELQDLKIILHQISQKDIFKQFKEQEIKLIDHDQRFQEKIIQCLSQIQQIQKNCRQQLRKIFGCNNSVLEDIQNQLEGFKNEIQNSQFDQNIFTNLIPKFKNELLQTLLVILKEIRVKGQEYTEQQDNLDLKIKQKVVLTQFDQQFKFLKNEFDVKEQSTQTLYNLEEKKTDNENQDLKQQQKEQLEAGSKQKLGNLPQISSEKAYQDQIQFEKDVERLLNLDGALQALCKRGDLSNFETRVKCVQFQCNVYTVDLIEKQFEKKIEEIHSIKYENKDFEVNLQNQWLCIRTENPFAFGMVKQVYLMKKQGAQNEIYVVKIPINIGCYQSMAAAVNDCRSHLIAKSFMKQFINRLSKVNQNIPKVKYTDFLLLEESPNKIWLAERLFKGEFKKYNNNNGYILDSQSPLNELAQAFSYYTYYESLYSYIISDIQGIDNYFTDPVINTTRGGFDETDEGVEGITNIIERLELKQNLFQNLLRSINVEID